jgi:hypothetical protein
MIAGTQLGNRSLASHATLQRDRSAMSAMTFSNVTVYTSRATSRDVTQLLVAPRSIARPKGLVLANIVWGELFLKSYFKKGFKKFKRLVDW